MKKCKWCGKRFDNGGSGSSNVAQAMTCVYKIDNQDDECTNCLELRHNIEADIHLANKILKAIILKGDK